MIGYSEEIDVTCVCCVSTQKSYLSGLREIHKALKMSDFFKQHEVIHVTTATKAAKKKNNYFLKMLERLIHI